MGKRDFYQEEKIKKYVYVFSITLVLSIVVFLTIFVMYNKKMKKEASSKLENLGMIEDIVSNDDLTETTSISSDLTVKEASNTVENKANVKVSAVNTITKENKKTYAKLLKVGFLFASGKIDEAENLFVETQKQKLDFMCNALVDSIMKCDRAMAMGDYKIVEAYNLKLLDRTYPKQDNLEKLLAHYNLGVVYEKLEDREKASSYYYYCINYGGETAIKTEALSRLRSMQ